MRVFYFNVTYACNSRCKFCAANHPILTDDNSQITLAQFKEVLSQNQVGSGDRVIINGGEPTVHPDFFEFLDAVQECNAKIDLFTNGKKLADEQFTRKVMEHGNMHIRIPLFGGTAEAHDFLTGQKGNFNAVTGGIDNVYGLLREGITLEIKMLLSTATVKENEKIYEIVRTRWTGPAVRMSLNPLLISDMVVMNKELFLDNYENLLRQSEPLLKKAEFDHVHINTSLIPPCAFSDDMRVETYRGFRVADQTHYTDPSRNINEDEMKGRERCRECDLVGSCNGYPRSYVNYFGSGVMKPIHIDHKKLIPI